MKHLGNIEFEDYGSNMTIYVPGHDDPVHIQWDEITPDNSIGENSDNYDSDSFIAEWLGYQDYDNQTRDAARDVLTSAWGAKLDACLKP